MEFGSVEGAFGRWETARSMGAMGAGVRITAWYDDGGDDMLTCRIIIDGQVIAEGSQTGYTY